MKRITIYLAAILISINVVAQTGTFTDKRDKQTYKWVKIGKQKWMAENLNYKTSSDSWYYDNNDRNCKKYGRLYTWAVAKKVCPDGWHLPSDKEWSELVYFIKSDGHQDEEGIVLKSTRGWKNNNNGTDIYGFKALPGGARYFDDDSFDARGIGGYWWSCTEKSGSRAFFSSLDYDYSELDRVYGSKEAAYSVRCVKD
jgi:uncharacterized protein (TIGR02145 family)